jgi:excisionase family DNA binding protein
MNLQKPIATPSLLSLEEVARQLGIHVKTARRQIRDGRLQAVRVGRQYRVAPSELARVMGQGTACAVPAEPVRRERHVEASTIVQIDAISPEDASRIVNGVGGAIKGRDRRTDTPLRVDTIYDETRARLKVLISGSLASTSFLLQLIALHTG